MDRIIVQVKEGKSGLNAEVECSAPESSTLMERALAASVAHRLPAIIKEEKKKLLVALKGVAGALRPEDIAMLEGKATEPLKGPKVENVEK